MASAAGKSQNRAGGNEIGFGGRPPEKLSLGPIHPAAVATARDLQT